MVSPDKSTVQRQAHPGISRPYSSWCHTVHLLFPTEVSTAPASHGGGGCNPGWLVMIVLLFAEIQGGPKTKQAAPDSQGSLR